MKKYFITVNGNKYEVEVEEASGSQISAPVKQESKPEIKAEEKKAKPKVENKPSAPKASVSKGKHNVTSPMPGTILKINVSIGDQVTKGDVLCVLEAMKMENDIVAPDDGTVAGVAVTKGSSVDSGDLLVSLD